MLTKRVLTKGCENVEALPFRPHKGLKNVGDRAPCFYNPRFEGAAFQMYLNDCDKYQEL